MIVSSPGKIILFGEHSVVYGRPCLASALGKRTYILFEALESSHVEIQFDDHQFHWDLSLFDGYTDRAPFSVSPVYDSGLYEWVSGVSESPFDAVNVLWYLYVAVNGYQNSSGFKMTLNTDLPIGVGLGSSASLSTCLVTCLLVHYGLISSDLNDEDLETVNNWAYLSECVFHGNPSGIDNTTCTYGGAVFMNNGTIERLNSLPLHVIISNTNQPRSTRSLVSKVGGLHRLLPSITDKLFDAITEITLRAKGLYMNFTDDGIDSVEKRLEIEAQFEIMMTMNHHILNAIGVGHPALDQILQITNKHQLYSKMTGAGGGGCAFTLLKENAPDSVIDAVLQALEDEGYTNIIADLGTEGVKIHSRESLPNRFPTL